ncbi:hypothetical protein B0J14DRAFT_605436 [Halenospora varia]|nr:hypothetical protein B0J14DRAFT_605436 [Halenospora varia]
MAEDTRVPEILVIIIVFFVLSTMTTALRLYLRLAILRNFGADDWLIIVALLFNTAYIGINLQSAMHGYGRHVWTVNGRDFVILLKGLYWAPITSSFTTGFVKLSILSLYRRLAQDQPHIRIIYGFALFVVLYTIALVLVGIFICDPINRAWDLTTYPQGCMKTSTLQTAQSAFNIATDAMIFIMPLPLIYRMTMQRHDKLIVILVLAMGAVAVIASALRIFFMHPGIVRNSRIEWYETANGSPAADMTWNAVNPGEWTLIEANLMIICASVFALRRLWVYQREGNRPQPAESVSDRRTLPLAGQPKPVFLSPLYILQRTSNSGMEMSVTALTAADKTAENCKVVEQSGGETSIMMESKELSVSPLNDERSTV